MKTRNENTTGKIQDFNVASDDILHSIAEYLREGETTFIYWRGESRSNDKKTWFSRNCADNAIRLQRTPTGIKLTLEKCRRTGDSDKVVKHHVLV